MRKVRATEEESNVCVAEIRAFHQLGQRLRKTSSDPADVSRDGGREWPHYLLDIARRFSRKYSEADLDLLCEQVRTHRPAFGISHVGILITIPVRQREGLQRKCIEQNWSTNALKAAKMKRCRKKSSGGRRPQVTKDNIYAKIYRYASAGLRLNTTARKRWKGRPSILDGLPSDFGNAIEDAVRKLAFLQHAALTQLRKTQRGE